VFFVVSFCFHHKARKVSHKARKERIAHRTHGLNGFLQITFMNFVPVFVFFVVSFCFHHKARKVSHKARKERIAHRTHGLNGFSQITFVNFVHVFVFFVVSFSPQRRNLYLTLFRQCRNVPLLAKG
jgi:hypothetical protein